MNFSQVPTTGSVNSACQHLSYKTVTLRQLSSDLFYGLLIATAVLSLAACPFTISLNALVMVAVKTKRRLQTHPNILLACMALTDLTAGLVVQPLNITTTVFLIQGKDFHASFCDINTAFTITYFITFWASIAHLVLISGERYFAIKHAFTHGTFVTNTRLLVSSALAWISGCLLYYVFTLSGAITFVLQVVIFLSISLLHGLIYREAQRHEKQILSQQASFETKAKFKKEKKALKLTTVILVAIFICCFLPLTVTFMTWVIFSRHFSLGVKTLIRQLSLALTILNSIVNPIIYTVRKREFRVAFIELLLRKRLQEAEEVEMKLFRFRNNVVNPEDEQEVEEQGQNLPDGRNAGDANGNRGDDYEVVDPNSDCEKKEDQDSTDGTSVTNAEREQDDRRNPANENTRHEDDPGVVVPRGVPPSF